MSVCGGVHMCLSVGVALDVYACVSVYLCYYYKTQVPPSVHCDVIG